MAVDTSAGSTLHICATQPGTYDAAGYGALTWTEVGEITDFGEFGRTYNLVTHNPVGSRGTVKMKGSFNEGSINLQLGLDNTDAGQALLKDAVDSDNDYSFKVTIQNGDIYYFQAQAMSFKNSIGGVDKVTSATCTLELTTNSAGIGIVEA